MILPTRSQLIRELSLTQTDLAKIARCRGNSPGEPPRPPISGQSCTKERFRNDSPSTGFSRTWGVRNGIAEWI